MGHFRKQVLGNPLKVETLTVLVELKLGMGHFRKQVLGKLLVQMYRNVGPCYY